MAAIPLADRFWKHVEIGEPDQCWPWTGAIGHNGYGKVNIGPPTHKIESAHRVAWELANGRPVKPGLCVLHRCDNRPCCNPACLWEGTQQGNILDCVAKDRHARAGTGAPPGERHPNHVLTLKQVQDIRERYAIGDISQKLLGRQYGVSQAQISHLVTGRQWSRSYSTTTT